MFKVWRRQQAYIRVVKRAYSAFDQPQYNKANDFYELLGVSPRASEKELKLAYYKKAQLFHPDKSGGDKVLEEKFKQINNAYDVLKDEKLRSIYDQQREQSHNPNFRKDQSPFSKGTSSKSSRYGQSHQTAEDFNNFYQTFRGKANQADDFFRDFFRSQAQQDKYKKQNQSGYTGQRQEWTGSQYSNQSSEQKDSDERQGGQYQEETKREKTEEEKSQDEHWRNYYQEFYNRSDTQYRSPNFKSKSKFQRFQDQRFEQKPVEKVYKKYEPNTESNLHSKNRGYTKMNASFKEKMRIFSMTSNPFRIMDYRKKATTFFDQIFKSAEKHSKTVSRDSFNRTSRLSYKDVKKMVPVVQVLFGFGFLSLLYKAVDYYAS